MANEAILRDDLGINPLNFTVADGTGIEKGTICKLTDPRTASAATGTGDVFAGIARREKIASDGRTQLGLYTHGIFDMKVNAGAAVTLGATVTTSGANLIRDATEAEIAAGKGIGKALETGAASETIQVLVGV